jgi:hypothetical protein
LTADFFAAAFLARAGFAALRAGFFAAGFALALAAFFCFLAI